MAIAIATDTGDITTVPGSLAASLAKSALPNAVTGLAALPPSFAAPDIFSLEDALSPIPDPRRVSLAENASRLVSPRDQKM